MQFLAEMSGWLATLAFVLGIIALILELFFVPGFGVAGVLGVILLGWGILLVSVDIFHATQALTLALVITLVALVGGVWLATKVNFWRKVTLPHRQKREEGYLAPRQELEKLLGLQGVAATPLRPAGTALIDGKRVDVVTEGEFIMPGTPVLVVMVEGTRVIVNAVEKV
ncbi:MAG: NfeD family protein [Bacillota bacterium]